jgi:two-component system LytT family response regulator
VIRALIVDDEPLARRALVRMLQEHGDVMIVGESSDGETALNHIEQVHPNLVFLDIRMPGQDGLYVAGELFRRFKGAVIFVTAYDQHALEAFNLNALDYLLKPFTHERLAQALDRVRERVAHPMPVEDIERLLASFREREAQPRHVERIPANRNGRIHLIPVSAIERIDAMGNYAKIHAKDERYDIRDTLQSLESKLDPETFVRVHRSTIINMDYVREVQTWFRGGHQILMKDGTQVRLSRYQTSAIEKLTGRRRADG